MAVVRQNYDYVLRCPICKANCAYGLYIHQFDPEDDDCCYFSCVGCISSLRTKVGVPASGWERWDESKIARHSESSWYPCTVKTQEIMEKQNKKKRKRKAPKKKKKAPQTVTKTDTDTATAELIEKIYIYVSSIEVKLRAIKNTLLEHANTSS